TEEDGLALRVETTEHAAKIVLAVFCFWQAIPIREPIVCIEDIVSEVIKGCAMELIRARPRGDGNLSSRSTPKFRGKGRSLNAKFLHRVDGNEAVGSPLCA